MKADGRTSIAAVVVLPIGCVTAAAEWFWNDGHVVCLSRTTLDKGGLGSFTRASKEVSRSRVPVLAGEA